MIILILVLFGIGFLSGVIIGLYYKNASILLALNILCWVGSFISAYFVWIVWQDRAYSENWAMYGFIFYSLPYGVLTAIMIFLELFFILKWSGNKVKLIRWVGVLLVVFIIFQFSIVFIEGL